MRREFNSSFLTHMTSFVATVLAVFCLLLLAWHPISAAPLEPPSGDRCKWSGETYADFYVPPELGDVTAERLGEIVRAEHVLSMTREQVATMVGLSSSPYGAAIYRILYVSQDTLGQYHTVSGLIVVPVGIVPAGGFPIVAAGHPTSGLADSCAPSRNSSPPILLLPWVAQGYVVSASDYQGLGTPGLHPYGVGAVAGQNLLDAARAALRFCDSEHDVAQSASNRIILEGHSQGGQAALFAHQIWPAHAPELNILGTIAFAPGSEMHLLAKEMADSYLSTLAAPVALAMYAQSEYYGAAADLASWMKEPYVSELPLRVEQECIVPLVAWFGWRPSNVFPNLLLQSVAQDEWEKLEPWNTYLEMNTPGNYHSDVPVLVIHGGADTTVPVKASEWLSIRLCHHETPTKLSIYPDGRHNAPIYAMPEALQWAADRLAGKPPVGSCIVPTSVYLPLVSH